MPPWSRPFGHGPACCITGWSCIDICGGLWGALASSTWQCGREEAAGGQGRRQSGGRGLASQGDAPGQDRAGGSARPTSLGAGAWGGPGRPGCWRRELQARIAVSTPSYDHADCTSAWAAARRHRDSWALCAVHASMSTSTIISEGTGLPPTSCKMPTESRAELRNRLRVGRAL